MAGSRSVPDWIEGYKELLENTESPDLFKKWVAISTVASAMKRKCHVRWFPHAHTYANMYIVLVGPAAIGKGVAMGPAHNMLRKMGVKMSAQCSTRQVLIQDMIESTESNMRDGKIFKESNLTIVSKEFSVFLGYNNPELVDYLTDWYDAHDDWEYKTIGRSSELVHGPYINLIGATTPSVFQKSLTNEALTGGLMSRTMLIYGDKKGKIVPIPLAADSTLVLEGKLYLDLQKIGEMEGEFKFSSDFPDRWVDWYMENEKHEMRKDTRLTHYAGRRQTHMMKLMMVVSAARSNDMIITVADFEKANELLKEAEEGMIHAFRGYGTNALAYYIEVVMEDIKAASHIYLKDLMKRHVKDISLEDMQKIIETLERMGFCKVSKKSSGIIISYTPESIRTGEKK